MCPSIYNPPAEVMDVQGQFGEKREMPDVPKQDFVDALAGIWFQINFAAYHMLGRFGRDSALRRWGLALCLRGGGNAKKRAVVAVARKLLILMHRLWKTQTAFVPFSAIQPVPQAA